MIHKMTSKIYNVKKRLIGFDWMQRYWEYIKRISCLQYSLKIGIILVNFFRIINAISIWHLKRSDNYYRKTGISKNTSSILTILVRKYGIFYSFFPSIIMLCSARPLKVLQTIRNCLFFHNLQEKSKSFAI